MSPSVLQQDCESSSLSSYRASARDNRARGYTTHVRLAAEIARLRANALRVAVAARAQKFLGASAPSRKRPDRSGGRKSYRFHGWRRAARLKDRRPSRRGKGVCPRCRRGRRRIGRLRRLRRGLSTWKGGRPVRRKRRRKSSRRSHLCGCVAIRDHRRTPHAEFSRIH